MADPVVKLKFEGDTRGLIRSLQQINKAMDTAARGIEQSTVKASQALKDVASDAGKIKSIKIDVLADTSKAKQEIRDVSKSDAGEVKTKVTADTSKAKKDIKSVGDDAKPVEVPVKADTSRAENALNGLGEIGASVGDAFSGGMASAMKGGLVVSAALIGGEIATAIADKISEGKQIQRALELQFKISPDAAKGFTDLFDTNIFEDIHNKVMDLGPAGKGGTDPIIRGLEDAGRGAQELASTAVMLTQNFRDVGNSGQANIRALTVEMERTAQIGGVDVVQAIKGADTAARTFGLSAWDATRLVQKGFVEMGVRGDDWAETLQEYSPYFKQLGLSADDAFNVVNTGMQHGARNTDVMADSFKELGIRVVDGSALSRGAMHDLGLDVDKTMQAFGRGGESARQATDAVIDKLNQVADPVERNRLGVAMMGTQWEDTARDVIGFINIMPGTTEALARGSFASEMAAEKAKGLSDAVLALRMPFESAATTAGLLTNAMDRLNGKTPSLREATQAWNDLVRGFAKQQDWDATAAGVQRLSGSLVDLKGEVNTTTEAGSRLQDWARGSQEAFNVSAGAMREAGVPAQEMTAKLQTMRDAFIRNAEAQGLPKAAAERLANAYGLIPGTVSTAVYAPGLLARVDELGTLKYKIESLPDGRFTVTADDGAARGVIQKLVSDYQGKVIRLSVSAGGVTTNLDSKSWSKHSATGGPVTGVGTWTSDSNPYMLSRDEWVVRAREATKPVNARVLRAMNAGIDWTRYVPTAGPAPNTISSGMPGPMPRGIAGGGTVRFAGNVDSAVATMLMKLQRDGLVSFS